MEKFELLISLKSDDVYSVYSAYVTKEDLEEEFLYWKEFGYRNTDNLLVGCFTSDGEYHLSYWDDEKKEIIGLPNEEDIITLDEGYEMRGE